jgi:hypothetical protein
VASISQCTTGRAQSCTMPPPLVAVHSTQQKGRPAAAVSVQLPPCATARYCVAAARADGL